MRGVGRGQQSAHRASSASSYCAHAARRLKIATPAASKVGRAPISPHGRMSGPATRAHTHTRADGMHSCNGQVSAIIMAVQFTMLVLACARTIARVHAGMRNVAVMAVMAKWAPRVRDGNPSLKQRGRCCPWLLPCGVRPAVAWVL